MQAVVVVVVVILENQSRKIILENIVSSFGEVILTVQHALAVRLVSRL